MAMARRTASALGNTMFFAVSIQRPDLFTGQIDYHPHGGIVP
jgi:hypothetical protein